MAEIVEVLTEPEDIDFSLQIATSIRKLTRQKDASSEWCIFKAPKRLLELDEKKAYHPLYVSIGPFHHGKEDLKSMEKLKATYLEAFLYRSKNINLETCIEMVKEWEQSIRNCYAETIEFSSHDFVKMIILDSCFLIEVVLAYHDNVKDGVEEIKDYQTYSRILIAVKIDMMLMENQLPFFVLQGLFRKAFGLNDEGPYGCLIDLCIQYLDKYLLIRDKNLAIKNIKEKGSDGIKHLLDLLRTCQTPSIPRRNKKMNPKKGYSLSKATNLKEAGIVIKPAGANTRSAADIVYTTGVLEIPSIRLNNISERVLRNLIALEVCLYFDTSFINDYVHFMDNLIHTSKDVDLLISKGVIESFSSDNQNVANLFNNLRPRLLHKNYYYAGIEEEVNGYCKIRLHKWRAVMMFDYCSSPWRIVSTIAAITLLILAAIQAVSAILSVQKKPSPLVYGPPIAIIALFAIAFLIIFLSRFLNFLF